MSLQDALNYPFKHRNLVRILPIAIMYSIVIFLVQYFTIEANTFLMFLSSLALFFFSVALNGFYVRVIRTVRHDNEVLPEFNQMREDVKPGCVTILGVMFHAMFVVLFVFAVSLLSLDFLLLLALPLMLVMWGVYTVGLVRYAFEFNTSVMFELSENLRLAREHLGGLVGLFGRYILIGLLSFGVSLGVNLLFESMILGTINPYQQIGMGTWLMLALVNIVSYTISLVFMLSQSHVTARFGQQMEARKDKVKMKNEYGRQF